jgi:hypothetical protein
VERRGGLANGREDDAAALASVQEDRPDPQQLCLTLRLIEVEAVVTHNDLWATSEAAGSCSHEFGESAKVGSDDKVGRGWSVSSEVLDSFGAKGRLFFHSNDSCVRGVGEEGVDESSVAATHVEDAGAVGGGSVQSVLLDEVVRVLASLNPADGSVVQEIVVGVPVVRHAARVSAEGAHHVGLCHLLQGCVQ